MFLVWTYLICFDDPLHGGISKGLVVVRNRPIHVFRAKMIGH